MYKFIIITIILSFLNLKLNPTKPNFTSYKLNIGNELTEQNVTLYMKSKNIKFLKLSLAQAKHESGNFTSLLCKTNNNLFGMRKAEIRKTTAIGSKHHYATYKNWKESINDFILFQEFIMKKRKTKRAYVHFITTQYAADRNYYKKLKKYL